MKITDLAVFVLIVLLPFSLRAHLSQNKLIDSQQLKAHYNEMVDNATKDAVISLMETEENSSIEIISENEGVNFKTSPLNLDKALWRFYQTMYLNLGFENDIAAQQGFFDKVPIKLVSGYDGYYINAWTEVYDSEQDKLVVKEIWQEKKPYSVYDTTKNIRIDYTLDEKVFVTNMATKVTTEGDYHNFAAIYPDSIYFGEKFDSLRRQAITENIRNDLTYHSQSNSLIAKKYGWQYNFTLPIIDNTAIDDISFIAFLQGLPLNGGELYNTYGLGSSKVTKAKKFYASDTLINGKRLYHKEDCPDIPDNPIVFDSAKEAAKAGYYPDPKM